MEVVTSMLEEDEIVGCSEEGFVASGCAFLVRWPGPWRACCTFQLLAEWTHERLHLHASTLSMTFAEPLSIQRHAVQVS